MTLIENSFSFNGWIKRIMVRVLSEIECKATEKEAGLSILVDVSA